MRPQTVFHKTTAPFGISFISVSFPNVTNMVAENLVAAPEMATIPGLSQMTDEHLVMQRMQTLQPKDRLILLPDC